MATYNKFQPFIEAVAEKVHDLGADTLALALLSAAPSATYSGYSQISASEVPYTALSGGVAALELTTTSSSQTAGVYTLVLTDKEIAASADSVGPFRYIALYNKSASASDNNLIGWWDYGASVTMNNTETFSAAFAAYTVRISG